MLLELIKAVALLLALCLQQGLIVRLLRNHQVARSISSGLLFGGICVIGMMLPIEPVPGVIFDPRSVVLSMAGLFGGTLVAAITALIAGSYRLWLGGGGVYVGVAVIITCAALGLVYRYVHAKGWVGVDGPRLLVFGLIVHIVEVLLFTQLPADAVQKVMSTVAIPLILTFTPATAILGLLLKDIQNRLKTESDLVESEATLARHLENTPLAAITWSKDFRCVQWNKAAERIFGYTRKEAIGRHAIGLVVPATIKADIETIFQSLLENKGGEKNINENITKDGRTIICEWFNTPISNENGQAVGVVSLAEDVTQKKQAEEELRLKNTLLTTQQEASIDGILSVDASGNIIAINHRCIELWGLSAEVVESGSDDRFLEAVMAQLTDPAGFVDRVQYLYAHRAETGSDEISLSDGRILERHSAPMIGADGQYYGRVWMFRDITARKLSDALIWNQANFDVLTGLANRQMLRDRLEQEIKQASRAGHKVALLYLDLDQFKDVNDTLGHDMGDILLIEASKRLGTCVREVDTVARLGGDEFIIIMGGLEKSASVERVANDILQKFSEPFQLGEESAYISASIGITFYPEDAADVDNLLKNADQAMYAAKDKGRNCYQYYTSSMQALALSRVLMAKDLRCALPESQFVVCYQPIVEMTSGAIHKAEALLRWRHPSRGLVGPEEFIPVAEETRMIIEIGDWVFAEVARLTKQWRALYRADFQITINTSPVQYRSETFDVATWLARLKKLDLPAQSIVVEITEGLLMESTSLVLDKLLLFRDAGIQVSLDDFGTGYSSLSYLKKFDIDYLKIDRSFVRNLLPCSDDLALCEAIIVMAHKLGLKVIAEGIETVQQYQLLTDAGCDYGQGYYFSQPVDSEEFEKLLSSQDVVQSS